MLRKSAKWLLLAAVVAFVVYRVKFAPVTVLADEAKSSPIIAEVMNGRCSMPLFARLFYCRRALLAASLSTAMGFAHSPYE